MNKLGLHAHDRGAQRLNLSAESVNALQRAADKMWFSEGRRKLTGTHYYSKIRDPRSNLLGYAAYKRIGSSSRKPRLILASILHKSMKPRGDDISHFFNTVIKDEKVKIETPKLFPGMPPIHNNRG